MNPKSMEPLGLAMRSYLDGDREAQPDIHRDDDLHDPMQVSHFFCDGSEFTKVETTARSC